MASNGIQETRQAGMSRSSTGLSNGALSDFEILSHTSPTGSQTPVSLSQINPLAMSQTPSSMTDITLEQALARVHELSRENTELRDYLKDNNEMMKKQFESLAAWKQKVHDANIANKDKFEQTKALIVGLRKDNEELLENVRDLETTKQEKENELLAKIHALESARLQSEQMMTHVRRQAEEQGMSIGDPDPVLQETVVVNVSAEAEEKISQLEREVEHRAKKVHKLKEDLVQSSHQVQQFRNSTDQLLKDLEGQQKLKDDLQKENQELNEKNLDLNLQLQTLLSDTRHSLPLFEKHPSGFRSSTESSGSQKRSDFVDQSAEKKNEDKLRGELNVLRSSLDGERKKSEELQQKLTETGHRLQHFRQSHDQEVATIKKEHEHKLMELARQQSTEKEQQLQSYNDADIQSLRSQVLTLISEVHETQTKLAAATDAIEKKDRRLHDLEEKNNQYQMDINQQRYELQAMIHQLQQRCALYEQSFNEEKQSHTNTKRNMSDLQRSFEQLVSDYKELLDTFDQYKTQQDRQSLYQPDQTAVSEQINHLTAQVMAAEEALNLRDSQIKALKDELHNKKLEYDDMAAVFKAQAEVYKADFDAERHAREKMVTEKERILSEMGDMQVQNQRLVDELESYSRKQLSEMQRRVAPSHAYLQVGNPGGSYGPSHGSYDLYGRSHVDPMHSSPGASNVSQLHQNQPPSRGSDPAQHDEDDVPLVCPQCNLVCPDMDTLQIHVIECLDQHEQRRPGGGAP